MSAPPRTDSDRRPTWTTVVTWSLMALGAAGVIVALASAWAAGANWDIGIEIRASQAARAIDPSGLTLDQAFAMVPALLESYGVLFWQSADWLHGLFGGDGLLMADDPSSYPWFGVLGICLSVVAAVALGATTARALESRWVGAFAGSLLLTTPLWLGHSSMNFKDVPVAAGLTLVATGSIQVWLQRGRWRPTVIGTSMIALGATVVLGVRAGSWPLLFGTLTGSVALLLMLALVGKRWLRAVGLLATSLVGVSVALAITWLTNPFARIDIPAWLLHSYQISKQFPNLVIVRSAGVDVWSIDMPRWYVPAWLVAQLPLLTIAVVIVGAVAYAASVLKRSTRMNVLALSPLLVQGIALPLIIIVTRSSLYDGIRHVLFVIPALVMLAAVGAWRINGWWAGPNRPAAGRVRAAAVPATMTLVVAASLFASVRWFPYTYAFVNPVASQGDSRRWELDYWGLSAREGIERLQHLGLDRVVVLPNSSPGLPFGGLDIVDPASLLPAGGPYGVYSFMRYDSAIPDDCQQEFEIRRDRLTLGRGYVCAVLPTTG